MCIRDRVGRARTGDVIVIRVAVAVELEINNAARGDLTVICLLYTSDAADERSSVDLGGRRIIKKKNT